MSEAERYILNPREIKAVTAIQFLPKVAGNLESVLDFCGTKVYYHPTGAGICIVLTNGEEVQLEPNGFIINSEGEIYPCPEDIFNRKYMLERLRKND